MQDLIRLDSDMPQYIHHNTQDELTHEVWINNFLKSHGEAPANLDAFRTLPSSKATGANQIGRLTNLMQLTVPKPMHAILQHIARAKREFDKTRQAVQASCPLLRRRDQTIHLLDVL